MNYLEEVSRFWAMVDVYELAVLRNMRSEHKILTEDMRRIAERYTGHANNQLSFDEVNVLRRRIEQYKVEVPKTSYQSLLMEYIHDHRRLKVKQALLCEYLMIYAEYQNKILRQYRIAVEKAVKVADPSGDTYSFEVNRVMPAYGQSLADMLSTNAEYYMKRLTEETERARTSGTINRTNYNDILKRAARDLLTQSPKTGNLHGILDRSFLYAIGERRVEELKRNGVEKVRFIAYLDRATTDACRERNGKVYLVKNLVVGKNAPPIYPPPHPCRSRLMPL